MGTIIFDRKYIKQEDAPTEEIKSVVNLVGLEAVLKLTERYGGEYLYFPQYKSWCTGERNRRIKREFDGANYRKLANRYNLTLEYCRELIYRFKKG
jgi:Mor family transcriptional regulator